MTPSKLPPPEISNLVGGFNPFEKYARQNGFIFPNFRGEHKKYLKPPPSNGLLRGYLSHQCPSTEVRLFSKGSFIHEGLSAETMLLLATLVGRILETQVPSMLVEGRIE